MTWLQIPRPSNDRFEWRPGPGDSLEVLSLPRPWTTFTLPKPDANSARTLQWAELAQNAASAYDLPVHWILGFIYAESGGKADAHASGSPCHGLMQINATVAAKGYGVSPAAKLYDPAINIDTGCQILRDHRSKIKDWCQIASMYNAGPSSKTGLAKQSTKNPWGFVFDPDYFDHVSMAANFFLLGAGPAPQKPPQSGSADIFPALAILGAAYVLRKL